MRLLDSQVEDSWDVCSQNAAYMSWGQASVTVNIKTTVLNVLSVAYFNLLFRIITECRDKYQTVRSVYYCGLIILKHRYCTLYTYR